MSRLQNKMLNYEVAPPADAWENIAASLDEGITGASFPARLYTMEVPPPAAAWQAIDEVLHPSDTVVVPMKKRTSFFRYAAAAVIIGIAATGILLWTTTGNTSREGMASAPSKATPKTPVNTPTTTGEPNDGVAMGKNTSDPVQPEPSKSTRRNNSRTAGYTYNTPAENDPIYAYEDHVPDMADRYIMLMTPDGNMIRMSKKWENMVCCVSGEEQDADCKSQLKKWQEKMASSTLAPSPGNFMDILSMVSSLDDNTEL